MEYLRDESIVEKEESIPQGANVVAYLSKGPNNSGAMDVSTCATDVPQLDAPEVFPKEGGHHKKEKWGKGLNQFKILGGSLI